MKAFFHLMLSTVLVMSATAASAEMLPTNPLPSEERARLLRVVQHPEIRARLIEQRIDAQQAEARVAALTDEEAAAFTSGFAELPAGAGGGDPSAIVFGVAIYLVIKYLLPYILIGGGLIVFAKAAKNHKAAHGSSSE